MLTVEEIREELRKGTEEHCDSCYDASCNLTFGLGKKLSKAWLHVLVHGHSVLVSRLGEVEQVTICEDAKNDCIFINNALISLNCDCVQIQYFDSDAGKCNTFDTVADFVNHIFTLIEKES